MLCGLCESTHLCHWLLPISLSCIPKPLRMVSENDVVSSFRLPSGHLVRHQKHFHLCRVLAHFIFWNSGFHVSYHLKQCSAYSACAWFRRPHEPPVHQLLRLPLPFSSPDVIFHVDYGMAIMRVMSGPPYSSSSRACFHSTVEHAFPTARILDHHTWSLRSAFKYSFKQKVSLVNNSFSLPHWWPSLLTELMWAERTRHYSEQGERTSAVMGLNTLATLLARKVGKLLEE